MIALAKSNDANADALARLALRGERARLFGYDAAASGKKRKAPRAVTSHEDDILPAGDRRKVTNSARDLRRNFSIPAWAIRRHLDYVSTFTFQAKTGDDVLNEEIEQLVSWWALPRNFDVAGRHSLASLVRLWESLRTVDGDVFVVKLGSGRTQTIESDRVALPQRGLPTHVDRNDFPLGVQTFATGRLRSICVCKRDGTSRVFERIVPARHVEQLAAFDRYDQTRGISEITAALNGFRDVYENLDYALAKAKVSQLFALAFYRDSDEAPATITEEEVDDDGDGDGDSTRYKVDFGKGPTMLDLDPGDRAEFLESNSPSDGFLNLNQVAVAAALKALDIPYSFFDESFTTYSGARQALLQYDQAASIKRGRLFELLDRLIAWRLSIFVRRGELSLPRGMAVRDLRWECMPAGLPWIDPLKEVVADQKSVAAGLNSRQRICRRRGVDFFEVADELVAEEKYLAEKRARLEVAPVATDDEDQEQDNG